MVKTSCSAFMPPFFLALALAPVPKVWANGVVGDYVFLEPLITQDPTPANELAILQPSWVRSSDANTYGVGFSMEKVLYLDDEDMPRVSVGGGSDGATLSEPPAQVTITYDAPIEKLFASLEVIKSAGQNEAAGKPEVSLDGSKLLSR